jgi:single-strand DNA-binding protein
MSGFQQIILVGNVGRTEELRFLPSGVPVFNFTVAVNQVSGSGENRTEKTVWFRVAAWRQLAETTSKFLTKGRQVMVVGTVDVRAYTDQSGQAQATLEVTAREVRFLGSRAEAGGGNGYPDEYGQGAPSDVGDIPF